jgi:hypothetical protein
LCAGLALTLPTAFGPVRLGPVTLSLYWMLLGVSLAAIGLQSFCLGCIVQVIYQYSSKRVAERLKLFSYNRAMAISGILLMSGLLLGVPLVIEYVHNGLRLPGASDFRNHLAVMGLLLIIAQFIIFSSTLVLHAADLRVRRRLANEKTLRTAA